MIPTWFLSMWISNSATTVMMVSILNCVIEKLREHSEQRPEKDDMALSDINHSQSSQQIISGINYMKQNI